MDNLNKFKRILALKKEPVEATFREFEKIDKCKELGIK